MKTLILAIPSLAFSFSSNSNFDYSFIDNGECHVITTDNNESHIDKKITAAAFTYHVIKSGQDFVGTFHQSALVRHHTPSNYALYLEKRYAPYQEQVIVKSGQWLEAKINGLGPDLVMLTIDRDRARKII